MDRGAPYKEIALSHVPTLPDTNCTWNLHANVGPLTRRLARCAATLLLAGLAVMVGGCSAGQSLTHLETQAEFDKTVMNSDKPVLMDFYKNGCPTCVVQEAVLDDLAKEYQGKVVFTKFKIREAYFVSSAPEIMDRYKLYWVPTVILFVNGKEKQRWTFNHSADEIRPALDEATNKPMAQRAVLTPAQVAALKAPLPAPGDGCVEGKGCPINPAGQSVAVETIP